MSIELERRRWLIRFFGAMIGGPLIVALIVFAALQVSQ